MSATVDRRIVEMQFDNKDFEKNVQESQKTLEKLKESLELEDSAKGLEALEKAGRKFNLDDMERAVDAVTNKFSFLGTIGDQVIRRLTDSVIGAFSKMKTYIDMFTIQPIYTGLEEYETQINSIQTIMSNTRDEIPDADFRLERVNDQLDQLNTYADKTIYNFTQMTDAIGRFTSAGVDLDTSVSAIKGIANMAAVSGANANQASSAMYMLSQALAAGKVQAYHWNSLTHAGMGGEQFQNAILRSAEAQNATVTVTKKVGKKNKQVKMKVTDLVKERGFKDSLSTGWLTDEILMPVLEQVSWDFKGMSERSQLDAEKERQPFIDALVELWTTTTAYNGKKALTKDEALRIATELVDKGGAIDAKNQDLLLKILTERGMERTRALELLENGVNMTEEQLKDLKRGYLYSQGYTRDDVDEILALADDATKAATEVKTLTQLLDTLREAAQSGWTESWRYILGNFNEAKDTLTTFSTYFGGLIDKSAKARNELLGEWHKVGYAMIWNGNEDEGPLGAVWNVIKGIEELVSRLKESLKTIFPPLTSEKLISITERIQEATARFYAWTQKSENMEKTGKIFTGIADALGILKDAAVSVWTWIKNLFSTTESESSGFLDFFASIGEWISGIRQSIQESELFQKALGAITPVVTTVKDAVVTAATTVWDWMKRLWNWISGLGIFDKLGEWFEKLGTWLGDLKTKVADSGIFQKIGNGFKEIGDWFGRTWSKIKEQGFFKTVGEEISGFAKKLPDAARKVKDWAVNLFTSIKNSEKFQKFWGKISGFFGPIIEKLKSWFSDLKTKIADSGIFQTIGNGFKNLWQWLSRIWDNLKGSQVFSKISGWLEDIGGWFTRTWEKIRNKGFFKTVGDGIASFTSKLPDAARKVKDWAVSLVDSIKNSEKLKKFWNGFKQFFGPILDAIVDFGKRLWEAFVNFFSADVSGEEGFENQLEVRVEEAGKSFAGFFEGLKEKLINAWEAVKGFVVPLFQSIKNFFIDNIGFILGGLGVFIGWKIGTIIEGFSDGFEALGRGYKWKSIGKAVRNFALAIAIIVGVILLIKETTKNDPDGFLRGGLILVAILGVIVGIFAGVGAAMKKTKFNGKALLQLAEGIAIIAIVIRALGTWAQGWDFWIGFATLTAVLGLLTAFVLISGRKKNTFDAKKLGLLSLAGGLIALAVAIKMFSMMSPKSLLKGGAAIVLLLGAILLFTRWSKNRDIKGMIGIAAAILILAGAMLVIKQMKWTEVLQGVAAIGAILLLMAVTLRIAGKSKMSNSIVYFVGMVATLITIMMVLKRLAGIRWTSLLKGVAAIGVILLTMAAALAISGIAPATRSIVFVLALVASMWTIVEALKALQESNIDTNLIISFAKSFALIMAVLAGSMILFGILPITAGLQAAGNFLLWIATVGGILLALGWLSSKWKDMGSFLDSGGDILAKLGRAIGRFVGSIAGGALEELGNGLTGYAKSIEGLSEGQTDADTDAAVAIAGQLSEFAEKLPKQNLFEKLFALPSDFGTFSTDIMKFGEAMGAYSTMLMTVEIQDTDFDKNKKLIEAASGVAELASSGKIPEQGSISRLLNLPTDFSRFLGRLNTFINAMSVYSTTLSTVEMDSVDVDKNAALVSAAEAVAELASSKKIPQQNFMSRLLNLPTDFSRFLGRLNPFVNAMSTYAATLSTVEMDSVDVDKNAALVSAAEAVAELASSKKIPQQDFISRLLNLPTDFGTFTEDIKPFGEAMAAYATAVGEVDFGTFTEEKSNLFIAAASGIAELNSFLEEGGRSTLEKVLKLPTDFKDFTDGIEPFGEAMKKYLTAINGLGDSASDDDIWRVTRVIESFNTFRPEVYGRFAFLEEIGTNIETFGTKFGSMSQGLSSSQTVTRDIENVKAIFDALVSLNTDDNFKDGIDIENIDRMLNQLSALTLPDFSQEGLDVATAFLTSLSSGLTSAIMVSNMTSSANMISGAGSSALYNTFNAWYNAGVYLAGGLAAGIRSNVSVVVSAGMRVANSTVDAIRGVWQVASPSKVGYELGSFFDLGIANGLGDYGKVVTDVAGEIGKGVVDSASTMLMGVDGSIFDNLDPNPTIRPVLDLTNVQNGVGAINGMLDPSNFEALGLFRGNALARSVGAMHLDEGKITRPFTDKNILERLDGLQGRIGDLGEAVTHMQIVLDSGTLIGETSTMIDDSLGRLAVRKGRGN